MKLPSLGGSRNVIAGLLSLLVVAVVIEGSARVAYTVYVDATTGDRWVEFSPELGWELRPNYEGGVEGVRRETDGWGVLTVDAPQIRDTTKSKVVFLGDSNTFGFRVETSGTFVEVLDSMAPDISAINLGMPGYTSYQGYRTFLKRALPLEPVVVVVSFNFNDRRYVLDDDHVDGPSHFQREYSRRTGLMRFLEASYTYRSLLAVYRKLGIANVADEVRLDRLRPRVSPESYRANLAAIVEVARSSDIGVVFMLLGDNPVQTAYLREGIRLLNTSSHESAIRVLRMAVEKNNWFSDVARIQLARAYREAGMLQEAEEVTTTRSLFRSLHGGLPIYPDTEYQQIMREVAREYGVELIDVAKVLDENPSDYLDFCHPDAHGHEKIAQVLYARLPQLLDSLATR